MFEKADVEKWADDPGRKRGRYDSHGVRCRSTAKFGVGGRYHENDQGRVGVQRCPVSGVGYRRRDRGHGHGDNKPIQLNESIGQRGRSYPKSQVPDPVPDPVPVPKTQAGIRGSERKSTSTRRRISTPCRGRADP